MLGRMPVGDQNGVWEPTPAAQNVSVSKLGRAASPMHIQDGPPWVGSPRDCPQTLGEIQPWRTGLD